MIVCTVSGTLATLAALILLLRCSYSSPNTLPPYSLPLHSAALILNSTGANGDYNAIVYAFGMETGIVEQCHRVGGVGLRTKVSMREN